MKDRILKSLEELASNDSLRELKTICSSGKYISAAGFEKPMLNLSSNDYLGLGHRKELIEEFLSDENNRSLCFTSSSSRLLTGTSHQHSAFEKEIGESYGKKALLVNSGYHANTGVLQALSTEKDLILADKLSHASIIDGIQMCKAKCIRFRHNDLNHLESLLLKHAPMHPTVFIVIETIYSMDGDVADIRKIVELKKKYSSSAEIVIYADEAHAMGVRGDTGLGVCHQMNVVEDVDLIMGTLGKGLASAGAFIVAEKHITDYLVNKMRPLIFTTALPPITAAWGHFIWNRMKGLNSLRQNLDKISAILRDAVSKYNNGKLLSESHIVPLIVGESRDAVAFASQLQKQGFYVLPIRPPTVPQGSSRLRFSLSADMTEEDIRLLSGFLS